MDVAEDDITWVRVSRTLRPDVCSADPDWYEALEISYVAHLEAQRRQVLHAFPYFIGKDRELALEILSGLKLLRSTLDVKLNQLNVTKQATDSRRRQANTMNGRRTILDPTMQSPEVRNFDASLRDCVVGQDRAVRHLARAYQMHLAGLSTPGRPLVNLLFLGPTGSGKTRLVEAAAEVLFGDVRAAIRVDCAEFQHSHEIAKLIGSPPGYLGHRETQPLITQEVLDEHQTEKLKFSLVLFDEIEKASDALWQLLLGILDKATLTLGDNRRVDFSRAMIFLTSNLGSHEVMQLMTGSGIGFSRQGGDNDEELDQKIYRAATEAARRKFSPEFMNRIDKVIVFRALQREHLEKILDIELARVQERIISANGASQFVFRCTPEARQFLLAEGTDAKFGARHLKRAIERHLVFPLSNLIATRQVQLGDFLTVDFDAETSKLVFMLEEQGALVESLEEPMPKPAVVPLSVQAAGATASPACRTSVEG